ncbi:fimbrial protein [Pseudomonas sp. 18175]|uniref:fimbrial protein n=1 Tax=Pseudomonas sp. 18175 TaxID=3390056 RepID=UPI003D1CE49B
MKHSSKIILTVLSLGLPISAQALCTGYPNVTYGVNFPDTITVPKSLPVGGMITSRAFNGPFPYMKFYCGAGMVQAYTGRFSSSSSAPGGVIYHTNVPGIGMRVIESDNYEPPFSVPLRNGSKTWWSNTNYIHFVTTLRAEFFKIGPVTNGTLASGNLQDSALDGHRGRIQIRLNNSVRFVNPAATCDLAAGDVNRTITFAPIKTSDLKDVNFAGMRNFELTANCTDATSVTFRFTGTPANGNSLFFANSGSAEGVALWMASNLNGAQQTISPNANNVRAVPVSGNRAVLPMLAAYHKNGTVRAGTLISTATISITYN